MRIPTNLIKDTSVTSQEKHDAWLFYLHLKTFHPLLAIRVFTSFQTCSQHFNQYESLKNILFLSTFFGAATATKFLLEQRRFYIPRSVLNPALRLNLNAMNEVDCQQYFRFGHGEIRQLTVSLQLPEVIITPSHGDRVLVVEGICLVLRRLSYPCRWFDLQNQFGRHTSALSRIFYYVMHLILEKVNHSIMFYDLSQEDLISFADAFARKGVPDTVNLFSVIDVKKQAICKPDRHQRSMYSGHKKFHCLKYQTLEAPNGLILHCSIGDDGRRGDGYVLRRSGILQYLRNHAIFNGFVVLGDSAYPTNDVMISIYKGRQLPPASVAFNAVMCPIRTSVEWGYEKIVRYWAFLDFKKQMKIQRCALVPMWRLGVFLTNCLTCAKGGNQISKYFGVAPPSLEEYILKSLN